MSQEPLHRRVPISLPSWVETNFRALLDAAPDAMIIVDQSGQIALTNTQTEALFGFAPSELRNQPVETLIPARFRSKHADHRKFFAHDPRLRPMGVGLELFGLRKNGDEFPVEISLSPLQTEVGYFVMAAIRDITARKKSQLEVQRLNEELQSRLDELARMNEELASRRLAEAAALRQERESVENRLKYSEAHFRDAINRAPHGIYAADSAGNMLWVNPAFILMLGYDSEEETLRLNTVRDIYADPSQRAKAVAEWESGMTVTGFETKWKRKDGKLITVRLAGRRVSTESGTSIHEVFVENVTEQRLLEQQFQHAQRMEAVGRLAGGIAHDFNNLLMVIGSSAQMVQEQKEHPENVDKFSALIRSAADKAAVLTRRLLAFSRQQILQPTVLPLNEVVVDICKLLPRLLGEDIEVVLGLNHELKNIYADRAQIEQALMNLAVNARDAMPHGGRLMIETANVQLDAQYSKKRVEVQAGEYVMLAISDTGTGMTQEVQAQIFEPFFTTKEVGKGTGLGLASVYGTVRQSGGFIWVYSELGKGSTFKLYFPSIEAQGAAAGSSPVKTGTTPGGDERVLLVEDEPTLRALSSAFLNSRGYRVTEAPDGAAGLRIFKSDPHFDLLITDVVMPEMSGPELAVEAKKIAPGLKVIFMSGYTDRAIDDKLVGPGVEFLQKPVSLDVFARTIRKVLEKRAENG